MLGSLLAALGIKKFSILIAGAVGGLISLQHYEVLTLRGKASVVVSSIFLANYGTQPLAQYFEAAATYELGIAAALGVFGMSAISSANSLIKDTKLWKSVISRFLGGEK